jgi:hypothetical protein
MPERKIQAYRESSISTAVVWSWLTDLETTNVRAHAKCVAMIRRLRQMGYELRRPEADFLRDDIYELRTKVGNVNYRILYTFIGKNVALLVLGCTKEGRVADDPKILT